MKKIDRLDARIGFCQTRLEGLMKWRLVTALALFAWLLIMALPKSSPYLVLGFLGLLVVFVVQVIQTRRYRAYQQQLKFWREFLLRQHQRSLGQAPSDQNFLPEHLSHEDKISHQDLNLFGPHSLFNLLDECLSPGGQEQLSQWMLDPKMSSEEILQRQNCLKSLDSHHWPLLKWRIRGESLKEALAEQNLSQLLSSKITGPQYRLYLWGHLILFSLMWLGILAFGFKLTSFSPLLFMGIYVLFALHARSQVEFGFSRSQALSHALTSLKPLFAGLEGQRTHKALKPFLKTILETPPSQELKRVSTYASLLSVQAHPLAYAIINLLFPLEYIVSGKIEIWRRQVRPLWDQWLSELYQVEALFSCQFFYHYQTKTFPQVKNDPVIQFERIFHPLINREKVIANSFSFPSGQRLGLITGSNMSGKSTFLRTIGLNQYLALMGCPIFGQSMVTFTGKIKSCLRVTDSLEEGVSTFYYEVKRISHIINAAASGESFLYLVDEIFRGTNNRERLAGSRGVIESLLTYKNILGFISTHDLELTQMGQSFPALGNWHFRDEILEGQSHQLHFSYRIQEGPCPSTNALRIMQNEGLPVPSPE